MLKIIKSFGKALICHVLERQVIALRRKHSFKLVVITGSVGKTTTKLAIVKTLETGGKVRYQHGNYNDRLTVPLALFGHQLPGLFNAWAWLKIFRTNKKIIKSPPSFDFAVLELGTDGPGQIEKFAYLEPELAVVTGLGLEHMEFFNSLEAVAQEELSVAGYCDLLLINADDCEERLLAKLTYKSYGLNSLADYQVKKVGQGDIAGQTAEISLSSNRQIKAKTSLLGDQGLKMSLAAAAVADLLGFSDEKIAAGIKTIVPVAGRLNRLKGLKGSFLLDDTYNASPASVKAALDVLYDLEAPRKIAILGSMNELGSFSQKAHQEVGEYCDAQQINILITIGRQAREWLATSATKKGCRVESFDSPFEAGHFVAQQLESGTLVLAKGSQNGVFAEEALKKLLANPADSSKLVRQSDAWLSKKHKQFKPI